MSPFQLRLLSFIYKDKFQATFLHYGYFNSVHLAFRIGLKKKELYQVYWVVSLEEHDQVHPKL